jgi:hypothetical protein
MATKLSKDRLQWAINETNSMKQASLLLNISYNTFKKYCKQYDLWNPNSGGPIYKSGMPRGFKPTELADILSGKNPNYSTSRLQYRLIREGYLEECCSNCGYDEYRSSDMTKPLQLDYLDNDSSNKDFSNLRLLCYNCYYLLKLDSKGPSVPSNVQSFTEAVNDLFSTNISSSQDN